MNAFRKLLLAPVALGLAAPVAAQAQSFDMGNVNRYTQQQDTDRMRALEAQMGQVTSVSQFSDVYPTDWAYQALANLVETYGCVAGYPDGTFKGNIALTRYEAAALLNACLDRVTEITEELKRLMKEFEKELVVLKARVDGLEAQTAELAATQFSTTTKLSGVAYFWLGAAVYNGGNDSPINPDGDVPAEGAAYSAAQATNTRYLTPGGALNNRNLAVPTAGLSVPDLTKAATWSGFTGSTGAWSTTANNSTFNGDTFATYGNANLANISYGNGQTLNGVAGGAAASNANTTNVGTNAVPLNVELVGGGTGQLGVNGLMGAGLTTGTPGFKTNAIEGMAITPETVMQYGNAAGTSSAGVTFSTFTLDKQDLANLVRLGNKARAVKGFGPLNYVSNVVGTGAAATANTPNAGGSDFSTSGYEIATGGEFTNINIYTDPYNASVAEYGTLSKAQANTKYVKKAAREFLKGLWQNDVTVGEAVSFNYDTRIDFNTSFTGKDLLRTRFRSGNFADSTFSGNPFPVTGAEIAYEEGQPNQFNVNRLFYQFPVGDSWTLTAGPVVRQDDMLAVWPSQYPADTILDFFTYAGAPGAYSLNLGAGAGVSYAGDLLGMDGFAVSANYVSNNGYSSFDGGIANAESGGSGTVQLAYTGDDWNITGAYAYSQNPVYGYIPVGTPLAGNPFGGLTSFSVSSWAISGWYAPDWGHWMPSVSAGWGVNDYTASQGADVFGIEAVNDGDGAQSQSWYVGMQWPDVFLQGNYLGTAVGQPTFISSNDSFLESDESTFAWEIWYKFQVTDNVSVTPAYFYVDNPSGIGSNSVAGGVLKTTFTF